MQEFGLECSHEPCVCTVSAPVQTGEAYCSEFCKNAEEGGIESDVCGCGHPQCDEP